MLIVGTFILGLLAGGMLHGQAVAEVSAAPVTQQPQPIASDSIAETAAPSDHIAESDISVLKDEVVIKVPNAVWARFTPTGSMVPVFNESSNAIEVVPNDASEINVGDIISYQSDWMDTPVIHRVVETGDDDQGWFAIVKGDNNSTSDPGKVRFEQVRRLVVAIIY